MNREELKAYLTETFPTATIGDTFDFPLIVVAKENLLEVVGKLKNAPETKMDFLFCETAVDRIEQFEIVYHLTSTTYRHDMVLKVMLDKPELPELPKIDSVYSLLEAAEFYENEIFDLFGVTFDGHPNLRRMILGDEWPGYPLRKGYEYPDIEQTLK
ncbi:MAG: NADH-quinone oxidoreductase subunit C [Bacteroidales bacterium]|nr:NADH-quinone oxidoreductase subunit C [Bacteroidales bacterium]